VRKYLVVKMKKRGKMEQETVVKLIAGVFSLLILIGVMVVFVEKGKVGWRDSLCAFSVRIASKTHFGFNFFPLACMPQKIGIKGDSFEVMSKISVLMKRCWWMFGESKIDGIKVSLGGDDIYTCYIIDPLEIEENIDVDEFVNFLKDSDGIEQGNVDGSVYNYIQKGDSIFGLCLDKKMEEFEGKKVYYIKFRDDVTKGVGGNEDQIMVSSKSSFSSGTLDSKWCEDLI